jgi:hypothetical protein
VEWRRRRGWQGGPSAEAVKGEAVKGETADFSRKSLIIA